MIHSTFIELPAKSVADDIVDYLEVKQQLLLTYCTNVAFYIYMKVPWFDAAIIYIQQNYDAS